MNLNDLDVVLLITTELNFKHITLLYRFEIILFINCLQCPNSENRKNLHLFFNVWNKILCMESNIFEHSEKKILHFNPYRSNHL